MKKFRDMDGYIGPWDLNEYAVDSFNRCVRSGDNEKYSINGPKCDEISLFK